MQLYYLINVNYHHLFSSEDDLLQSLLQILDDFVFVPAHLLQSEQLMVGCIYLLDQIQDLLRFHILRFHLLLHFLFMLRPFLLLFLILGSPGTRLLCVLRQASLLLRFLKFGKNIIQQFLDDAGGGIGDVFDVGLGEL